MNAIAAAVRGAVGMAAPIAAKMHAPDRVETLPFPHLREALLHAGDHFERDFEFGLRALARGLLAEAPPRPVR